MTLPVTLVGLAASAAACVGVGTGHPVLAATLALTLLPLVALMGWLHHRGVQSLHEDARRRCAAADETEKHYLDAERHYFQVLSGIVEVAEAKDRNTAGRSERIARLAELMARHLGIEEDRARLLGMVAQVHDIGLLAVPDRILQQTTHLQAAEYHKVQVHPEIGYRILEPLRFLTPVLGAVLSHHERMNGTGYPMGLKGERISVEARILAVAEAFEALTHDRPHRPGLTAIAAFREIARCADTGYDRACVDALGAVRHLTPASVSEPPPILRKAAGADEPACVVATR